MPTSSTAVVPNKSNRIALHFQQARYKGPECYRALPLPSDASLPVMISSLTFLAAIQLAAVVAYWIN